MIYLLTYSWPLVIWPFVITLSYIPELVLLFLWLLLSEPLFFSCQYFSESLFYCSKNVPTFIILYCISIYLWISFSSNNLFLILYLQFLVTNYLGIKNIFITFRIILEKVMESEAAAGRLLFMRLALLSFSCHVILDSFLTATVFWMSFLLRSGLYFSFLRSYHSYPDLVTVSSFAETCELKAKWKAKWQAMTGLPITLELECDGEGISS